MRAVEMLETLVGQLVRLVKKDSVMVKFDVGDV